MDGFDYDGKARRATVSGELTIMQATAFRSALLEHAEQGLRELDLSHVSDFDVSALQVLIAAERAIEGLAITERSEAVRDAMRLAGWAPNAEDER